MERLKGVRYTEEGINEYHRMYYQKNKKKILEYQKKRRIKIQQYQANCYTVERKKEC